jgi:hypothetical protein
MLAIQGKKAIIMKGNNITVENTSSKIYNSILIF